MMTTTTRPVRVYHTPKTPNENGIGYHYPRVVQHERVKFHQFATESTELDVGAAHCTVAVIELLDGTVITAGTHMIQFLDVGEAAA